MGVLVVVETDDGIVLTHPPGSPAYAPASLPSAIVPASDRPADIAVRIVHEQTGLDVVIVRDLGSFIQEGTPAGTIPMYAFVARDAGGNLRTDGPEGPARSYAIDALPAIVPIRVANQRALAAYLAGEDLT